MTITPIPRRGLYATYPNERLRPGTPNQPWELWLTGTNALLPMPDLATALMAAAEHNALAVDLAVDLDGGSPIRAVSYAVVLQHGYAWRRRGAASLGARVATPSLCWTARCGICGEIVEDEYIPHHPSPEDAAHDAARTQARTQDDTPEQPDPNQLTCL
ncbi:hypothetical protein ACIQOV_08280 [Kitasatospora sp. NPDC091257]|uniref:hypothetical protein n=1 Tax=Kitasatospora sp. NPDC091257 TaxID=3364084 RepID=UPI00382E0F54